MKTDTDTDTEADTDTEEARHFHCDENDGLLGDCIVMYCSYCIEAMPLAGKCKGYHKR